MLRLKLFEAGLVAAIAAFTSSYAGAQEFSARLSGFNELPAILTDATGKLTLELDKNTQTATYTLTYSGFTSAVTVAHIHFGKVHVAGTPIAFLCGGGTKPACPPTGSVSGTIAASDILAIPAQNVTAGDFDALEDALTSNTAYANVHTKNFAAGEIRGQVRRVEREDQQD